MVHRERGQLAPARAAFEEARSALERRLLQRPGDHVFLAGHGIALAGLGRSEEAMREGRRAVEARPISRDAIEGPLMEANLARIYTMIGRDDAAVEQLEIILSRPGPLSPRWLRGDPFWARLRGNPRFQRLVAERPMAGPASRVEKPKPTS
jgi:tetratricopeptide (TPR) repeat protein